MTHKTAIIDSKAKISDNVKIGPYTVIGPHVEIGEGTIIQSHVNITGKTKIGLNNKKLSRNEWDEIRILYQILSYNEYKHDLLPSEIGLDYLVDLKKGCYPGQEIHARMEGRGKLKKKIMKFNSDSNIYSGKFLTDNKKKINITTSIGKSGFFLINNIGEEKLIIDNVILEINELKSIKIC